MPEKFVSRNYLAVTMLALLMGWSLTMPIPFIGGISFLLYVYVCGRAASRVLGELFAFTISRRTSIIGMFLGFFTLGAWLCVVLLFTTLTPLMYVAALIANGVMWAALEQYVLRRVMPQLDPDEEIVMAEPHGFGVHAGVFVYAVLFIAGCIMLYQSRTGEHIVTPWQTIHPHFIYIFALATIVLGWLSLTRLSVRSMALLFMFHLFLMHAYVPLTHKLFYGADGWRHIANVQTVMAEEPLVVAKLSETPSIGARIGVVAYGQLWGSLSLLARITGLTPIWLVTWFVPIMWAMVFPLLMVELAAALSLGRRGTFYLLWATLFPFALQAAGAFTLPVNYGLLGWVCLSILLAKRLQQSWRDQLPVLGALGVLMLFSYSLHALLFWFSWVVAEVIRKSGRRVVRGIMIVVSCVLGVAFLPALELLTKYSSFKVVDWAASLKQVVGNFTGWFIASGPRSHDIATGNIVINQTPALAFVPNALTQYHGWLVVVGGLFMMMVVVGAIYSLLHKDKVIAWFGVLTVSLTGGYIVSRYFLGGEQLFTRRLDGVLAILFCVVIVLLLRSVDWSMSNRSLYVKLLPLALILDALVISGLYTLGPDTGTVSVDQVQAMEYVWQQEKDTTKHCVIADTYPLLALEAISGKQIIGGGFPINEYFAQPELQAAWKDATGFETKYSFSRWYEVTGSSRCFIVAPTGVVIVPGTAAALPGWEPKLFGEGKTGMEVWSFDSKK